MRKSSRLPTRFPEGTKYVLESYGGEIRRFVEFPDGRRITLAKRKALACCATDVSIVPPTFGEETIRKAKRTGARALQTA